MGTVVHLTDQSIQLSANNWNTAYQNVSSQSLNTTDNVLFNQVNANVYLSGGINLFNLLSSTGGGTGRDDVNTLVIENSATWIDTSTTVQTNSANWNTAYNTATVFQSNSASYATRSFVDGKFLPLSGGTITGNLSVLGDITYLDTAVSVVSTMFIDTNSTETALRITQKGSGDVIRVEDSANPDATPFIVKSDGLVGIGTDSPNSALTVIGNVSATGTTNINGNTFINGRADIGAPNAGIRIDNYTIQGLGGGLEIRSGTGNTGFNFDGGTIRTLNAGGMFRHDGPLFEQRNGTSPTTLRLYNTYTAGTPVSSEFGYTQWSGNTFRIGTSATGSGSVRNVELYRGESRIFVVGVDGYLNADTGYLTNGLIRLGASQPFYWNNRSMLKSPADGQITLSNLLETDFARLNFGGTTAAFPALKNSLSGIQIRRADDSNFAPLSASIITASQFSGPSNANLLINARGTTALTFDGNEMYMGRQLNGSGTNLYNFGTIGFGNASSIGDAIWARDAADTIAQRRGLNPQTYRVYNTYTAGTPVSSEFAYMGWSGNTFQLGTSATGGGSIRNLELYADGLRRFFINSTGEVGIGTTSTPVTAGSIALNATVSFPITGDAATGFITAISGHNFLSGDRVVFFELTGGSGIGGGYFQPPPTTYFVRDLSGSRDFRISTSSGGTPFTFTTNITAGFISNLNPTTVIRDINTANHSWIVLQPKGNGGIIAGPRPDGTVVGGNIRGDRAVDLQLTRSAATQVCSGQYGTVVGGAFNSGAGRYCVVGGISNTITNDTNTCFGGSNSINNSIGGTIVGGEFNSVNGNYGTIIGGLRGVTSRLGQVTHANGRFSANGDAQHSMLVLRNKSTSNTPVELFTDGGSGRFAIPSNSTVSGLIHIAATTSGGEHVCQFLRECIIRNRAGTTELRGPVTTVGTDTMEVSGCNLSIQANDTNDSLQILFTGYTPVTELSALATTDQISGTNHGFVNNDDIVFTDLQGGAGITATTTTYWVISAQPDTFYVSLTRGGTTPINITTNYTAMTATRLMRVVGYADFVELGHGT